MSSPNTSRIKKLSGQVIDQIAAGEVIERPSQLIKELIENSLDAGAQKVELSLSSGLSQITIKDDGTGILKEDLPLVFERHSTSKISDAEELFSLNSFGFRGEALSAIGSVAKIHLETKNQQDGEGSLYIWERGEVSGLEKSEISEGTKLSVSQLFDNTPARKKFLKSQRYETTLIKRVFNSFALQHFDKDFKLLIDGKLQSFYSSVSSLPERYKQVVGKKVFPIEIQETEFIRPGSFIYLEEPSIESKTSNTLWIYIQKRWIEDKAIHAAVRDGLNTYLMHGCQPRGLVDFYFDPAFVDVNVHPMKSQVRFQDSGHIYKAVRKAVSQWAERAPWNADKNTNSKESFSFEPPGTSFEKKFFYRDKPQTQEVQRAIEAQTSFKVLDQQTQYKKTYGHLQSQKVEKVLKEEDGFEPLWSKLMVVGQVNLTYLLCQSSTDLYLIDQHAAHERVGFEKLIRSWKENQGQDVQTLLLPLHMDVEETELDVLLEKKEDLKSLGVVIEQGGPQTLVLTSLPSFLKEAAVEKALRALAGNLIKYGGGTDLDEIFELFFATVSCHSVIRAGHAMSEDEIRLLLLEMDRYRSNFCPHGRPVYKKISFQSLDRDFGRTL